MSESEGSKDQLPKDITNTPKTLDRRSAITRSSNVAVASIASFFVDGNSRQQESSQRNVPENAQNTDIERVGNMAHITKSEGTYSLIYANSHSTVQEIPPQFPTTVNGIFLEGSVDYTNPHTMDYLANRRAGNPLPQYEKIIPYAEENHIPIYLGDPGISKTGWASELIHFGEYAAMVGETTIGADILAKAIAAQKNRNAPINRRDLLKLGAASTAALWLSSPAVSMVGRALSSRSGVGEEATINALKAS